MLVGLLHLHVIQLFGYSWIKAMIQFFQGSCKHVDWSAWFS